VLTSAVGSLIVYLIVAGGFGGVVIALWARVSELSAALIVALSLSMAGMILASAALILVILDRWRRGGDDTQSLAEPGGSKAEVISDGILWKHDGRWRGGLPEREPLCPEHRVPLMIWKGRNDEFVYSDDRFEDERDELWCRGREASEKHEIKLTESRTWQDARRLAGVRVQAKVAENDSGEYPRKARKGHSTGDCAEHTT